MILSDTTEERRAALSATEAAYHAWADRHGVDADEATDAQLAELDQLQADTEERAVAALRTAHPPEADSSTAASPLAAAPRGEPIDRSCDLVGGSRVDGR